MVATSCLDTFSGVRGKQFSITEDKDILSMYDEYQGRREIIMWMKVCKPHVNARSMADDGSRKWQISVDNAEASSSKRKKGNSNYQGHLSKMSKVEEIVEDLERRHGENNVYTPEQIRVWAHMIQLKHQLDKWHMLLERGAISSDQYQQLHDTTLSDIKRF